MTIQDRTHEFQACVATASKRLPTASSSRQALMSSSASAPLMGSEKQRKVSKGEFARRAAEIGRQITATMGKLERLALLAKRRTLFDDRPVEIAELTYIIKQDLSAINTSISALQQLNKSNSASSQPQQVGEHSKNVVVLLQGKLTDVTVSFKEVLEVRTKNIQRGRERTENFVSSVRGAGVEGAQGRDPSPHPFYNHNVNVVVTDAGVRQRHGGAKADASVGGGGSAQDSISKSHSPLYQTPSHSPAPPNDTLLTLDPEAGHGGLYGNSQQQSLMMEEHATDNSYLNTRSDAITAIESTIHELGSIFSQLAQMVSEQHETIQRIDANTEDVVANVSGAQRELMKYWGRVSSNRWLVVKMFGVLMIFFLLWVLVSK